MRLRFDCAWCGVYCREERFDGYNITPSARTADGQSCGSSPSSQRSHSSRIVRALSRHSPDYFDCARPGICRAFSRGAEI
jgi:hypothetical protein